VGPSEGLGALEKRKNLALAGNRKMAFQPIVIPSYSMAEENHEIHRFTGSISNAMYTSHGVYLLWKQTYTPDSGSHPVI
jgi:hypothetical protein